MNGVRFSGHRTRNAFDRYNIVEDEDVRNAVKAIEAGPAREAVTIWMKWPRRQRSETRRPRKVPRGLGNLARPRGFEPLALGFVAWYSRMVKLCNAMQIPVIPPFPPRGPDQDQQPDAGECKALAAPVLRKRMTPGEYRVAKEPLLTVRQVADLLRVCPATVYALCAEGKIFHIRVQSAIRIPGNSVGSFLRRRERGKSGKQQ